MEITEKKWRDLQLIYCRDVNCKHSIAYNYNPDSDIHDMDPLSPFLGIGVMFSISLGPRSPTPLVPELEAH